MASSNHQKEVTPEEVLASHTWQAPPPGQGRNSLCLRCGQRKSVVRENAMRGDPTMCAGPRKQAAASAQKREYDPYAPDGSDTEAARKAANRQARKDRKRKP